MDSNVLLAVFVAVEGAHAFSAFMPSAFTIQKFARDNGDVARLRAGYGPAVGFNVVLALAVSGLSRSYYPIFAAVLVSVFMVGMYERQIRGL